MRPGSIKIFNLKKDQAGSNNETLIVLAFPNFPMVSFIGVNNKSSIYHPVKVLLTLLRVQLPYSLQWSIHMFLPLLQSQTKMYVWRCWCSRVQLNEHEKFTLTFWFDPYQKVHCYCNSSFQISFSLSFHFPNLLMDNKSQRWLTHKSLHFSHAKQAHIFQQCHQ